MQRPRPCIVLALLLFSTLAAIGAGGAEPGARFSRFSVEVLEVELDGESGAPANWLVAGHFAVGERSDGLDPLSDDVVLAVGGSVFHLPGGSLRLQGSSYTWAGTVGGTRASVILDDHGSEGYAFAVAVVRTAAGAPLPGGVAPVLVILIVGADGDRTEVPGVSPTSGANPRTVARLERARALCRNNRR